ncbi:MULTISPECIES: DNA polymerase III subunit epsilon [Corallincola]|uniref:DNA polymerase III subunit epsilon n=3 Tax=Corallincola TaxID=1775176 RepID=A0A368NID1_9GAMM|nr:MULTISPECIES: DNA polymerase III subunit epsilon [Corallincola]RCU50322.1 DNA polymerase III subunit epsilon [Corallincola holothuriorum]TAA48666.1 DNA polymerase III subunit epsilon [Corallincola spongiicola]TCI05475.1 DNA polymerase III subunit epsilon [Corallincola luteus]
MSANEHRQVVLDTETTGMNQGGGPIYLGHRIIEIGCVEVINRRLTGRHYHVYINPDMPVDPEAIQVHGITDEMLADKPRFAQIADDFVEFIRGAELVIHNAPFDVGFMDHEFSRLSGGNYQPTADFCGVLDTLLLAKQTYPGQKNNLDALCRRLGIDNSHRELHGALLDAEILADVYLLMTGGQTSLELSDSSESGGGDGSQIRRLGADRTPLQVVMATADELKKHQEILDRVEKKAGSCLWRGEA